jgi:cyclopropane fatty-acyl-phospholipid synthase-like methyltransferase
MNNQTKLPTNWNHWNATGGPKYPQEKIIQFVFRNFPREIRKTTKALDLGCGSGVHTVFLAAEGFETYGIDISAQGVANTKHQLENLNLLAQVQVASMEAIDVLFPENYFDLILSSGVFECAGAELTREAVEPMYKVLKPGGKGFFIFASEADWQIQGDNPLQLHGFSESEVKEMFAPLDWSLFYLDRYITTYQNGQSQSHDFLITVQK